MVVIFGVTDKRYSMINILVTFDFNRNEELLIDKAVQLAEQFDSKVWIIHIASPDPYFVGYDVGPQYIRDGRSLELRKEHKILQEHTNVLKQKGISNMIWC